MKTCCDFQIQGWLTEEVTFQLECEGFVDGTKGTGERWVEKIAPKEEQE